MLAPPVWPTWLPPAVAREAERILGMKFLRIDLLVRLATDERMETVWDELKKHKPFPTRLSEQWADMRGLPVEEMTDQDAALTLFFWCAYIFALMRITARPVAEYDAMLATYRNQAEQLRASAVALRDLHLVPGSADKFLQYGNLSKQFADIHASQIVDAAKFCDEIVDAITELKGTEPLIVPQDYGNLQARGYIRWLPIETRNLFGMAAPHRTLARVASVALEEKVTDVQARNWCDPLPDDA